MHSYGIADLGLSTSIHVLSGSLAFVACIIVGRREEKIGTKFRYITKPMYIQFLGKIIRHFQVE